jgi:carbonic anhydrase
MKRSGQLTVFVALLLLGIDPSNADNGIVTQQLTQWADLISGVNQNGSGGGGDANRPGSGDIWGYSATNGPDQWANLDPSFSLCGNGTQQSPIDIVLTDVVPHDLPDITYLYQPSSILVFNNGHTLESTYDPGSYIILDGVEYDLKQVHFHSLSEHTVAFGAHYPLEMHLVHTDAAGNIAVVAIFIKEGAKNQALQPLWQWWPKNAGHIHNPPDIAYNVWDALPQDRRSYRYTGSLTTPPCSENVKWVLLRQSIEMSTQQLGKFRDIMEHSCCAEDGAGNVNNRRPIQPLNGRQVVFDTTQDAS